jgi:xylose isomerase
VGADIEANNQDFESLEAYMLQQGEITPNVSGRQEMVENLINQYM